MQPPCARPATGTRRDAIAAGAKGRHNAAVSIALRAPVGWLGPGRLVEDVLVVVEGARVAYAGPRAAYPGDYDVEDVARLDGFLMPGVVDRHVHIGLTKPGPVVRGGVT